MEQANKHADVVLGVDTHLDTHVVVLIDTLGRVLGTESIATDVSGYRHLVEWATSFGPISRAGVEGTGTYGAGLARYLSEAGIQVIEVNRPNRLRRRRRGKSDPTDAENAARAVLSGEALAEPKTTRVWWKRCARSASLDAAPSRPERRRLINCVACW